MTEKTAITSPSGRRVLSYLPGYYHSSRVVGDIVQAEGIELDALCQALDEILGQMFIRTATWGLDRWEAELGLPPPVNQTIDERRDRLVARLRGFGTVTVALVQRVAESFNLGTIDVVPDVAVYTVTIRFIDTRGIPSNLGDLQAALRAVLPAHLAMKYEFRYFLWDDLDAKGLTWDQWDALGLTWDQTEVYR